jgi:aspartyl/glutamyl-tRNA(Asn/Gln) amidotransferase C subunit
VAKLSSLQLEEGEVDLFIPQIGKLLEYVGELAPVAVVDGIDSEHTINVFREDRALQTDSAALLALAPQCDATSIVVPKILDSVE